MKQHASLANGKKTGANQEPWPPTAKQPVVVVARDLELRAPGIRCED